MARFSFRNFFQRPQRQTANATPQKINVWASLEGQSATEGDNKIATYDNAKITFSGDPESVDYESILRDKQRNINTLYQLADYYTDADPIVHGIIKHVYVPFASGDWYLTCENEKTIAIFEEYYKRIHLQEKIDDIMTQYFKYANVYCYIWNGQIMTLNPMKCVIGNTSIDGTPIVDYNVQDLQMEFRQRTYSTTPVKGIDDETFERVLEGYPPEIAVAIRNGTQYATLNPDNLYVFQASKEGWLRYAIPWIASALPALAKKELIANYEASQLNIGMRSYVEVRVGDEKMPYEMLPDQAQLGQIKSVYKKGMSGYPLVVVPYLAQSTLIQADMSDLYQWPMYDQVNADILSAGGISGIIIAGTGTQDSTFASAQVSVQSAAARIEAVQREFEDFMMKVNIRLIEDIKLIHTNNLKNVPEFHFAPLSMNGQRELREQCKQLWMNGLVSSKTYLEKEGYSLAREKKQRELESSDGTDDIMTSRINVAANDTDTNDDGSNMGRPTKDDSERNSDPENSKTSKITKEAKQGDTVDTDDTT